jgi:hypothetical protein
LVVLAAPGGWAWAGERLAPPAPERQVVESQQRVSDGRKLQREADQSLRKADAPPPAPPAASSPRAPGETRE